MALLEVYNLTKNFGYTEVLRGVSFSLERGQVLAIIGSSGSGKTTLLRCLNFLEFADEGEILVNGKVLTGAHLTEEQIRENRLHFGLVFQNFNLFPQYTALENVMLAGQLLANYADVPENLRAAVPSCRASFAGNGGSRDTMFPTAGQSGIFMSTTK